MDTLANNIKNSKLFKGLTTDEITDILKDSNYKDSEYTKGQIIFNIHQNSQYIGIIVSGTISVEKLLPSGKSIFMYSKTDGDIFGEVAAFSNSVNYPCNAISKNNVRILIFEKTDFFNILSDNKVVLGNFLNIVCNKAFSLNSHIGSLSFTSAKQKVAQSILDYADEGNSLTIRIPFCKKTWADRLNVSRASLYRELDSLCNDRIISLQKSNEISILDRKQLELITLN